MKKNVYIITGVTIVIIAGSWLTFSDSLRTAGVNEKNIEKNSISEQVKKEVVLAINDGSGNVDTLAVEFKEGMTAFDLLKEGVRKLDLALKVKDYDIGIFIELIGDKKNGQDGKYWLYYVNGQPPMVAADKEKIKIGDKVEFKFEKSPL